MSERRDARNEKERQQGELEGRRVGAGRARERQDHLAEPQERPPVPQYVAITW